MNDSVESGAKDLGVIASEREAEVTKDLQSERVVADSPFGSAGTAPQKEAVRELAPILDLPEPETSPVNTAQGLEAPRPETASAPPEESELLPMVEPVVEAPAPEVTTPTMSADQSIVEDPMFGPLKRLLVDLVGEG